MRYTLKSKPKNPTIIEGFPGFGLVGTIATEFLIKHLNAKEIGWIRVTEVPPVIAVHEGRTVEPLGIFYSKEKNLVILHALANVQGFEWQISDILMSICKDLNAKEIISLEGVGSEVPKGKNDKESRAFYISKNVIKKIKSAKPMTEGIIMGVTGSLVLKKNIDVTSIFAETSSNLPDSRAAAKVIQVLNEYLGLGIDPSPLVKKAELFEGKIKGMISKANTASVAADEKKQSYFG
jgi:uncharacterized protein